MDEPITRAEHEEFKRRIEEENRRQNRRIEILETNTIEMNRLTTTVAELAVNMDNLLKAQGAQDERIKTLEGRDGEMWRKLVSYAVTAVVGVLIGFVCTKLGLSG